MDISEIIYEKDLIDEALDFFMTFFISGFCCWGFFG